MPKRYPFLEYTHPKLYDPHVDGWHREERRLYGGDAVLSELLRWKAELDDYYTARVAQAGYLPLPKLHATTLTGHLSKETPTPEYGRLGSVRERGAIDRPTLAELLHYNVDGVGQDGTELMPWFDGVQERAIATGYRWVLVEKPSLETLRQMRMAAGRDPEAREFLGDDAQDGFRPYAVEYSPLAVPFWQFTNGQLDFAVIRIALAPSSLVNEGGNVVADTEGRYLLVRRGFRGLGDEWAGGGWWKFDSEHDLIDMGDWSETRGLIPLFPFIGEPSPGTTERPAIARSLTMELGQIAVGLMNRISERNWNITFSAKSINYILGIDSEKHALVLDQQDAGSITVGVPPVMLQDGTVGIPTMWNSSAAALDSQVFATAIEGALTEAKEIMVRQVTSTPDSSGRSKEAGFAEATSPLLARLAGTRQQAINTFLHFASLRLGIAQPNASVTIPREFDLQPVVDDIEATLSMLKRSWLRSSTWERHLLLRAGDERGMLPEDRAERAQIEAELEASATPTEPENVLEGDEGTEPGRRAPAQASAPAGVPGMNGADRA